MMFEDMLIEKGLITSLCSQLWETTWKKDFKKAGDSTSVNLSAKHIWKSPDFIGIQIESAKLHVRPTINLSFSHCNSPSLYFCLSFSFIFPLHLQHAERP